MLSSWDHHQNLKESKQGFGGFSWGLGDLNMKELGYWKPVKRGSSLQTELRWRKSLCSSDRTGKCPNGFRFHILVSKNQPSHWLTVGLRKTQWPPTWAPRAEARRQNWQSKEAWSSEEAVGGRMGSKILILYKHGSQTPGSVIF